MKIYVHTGVQTSCPSFTWQLKKAGRRRAQELKEQEVLKKRFQELKEAEAREKAFQELKEAEAREKSSPPSPSPSPPHHHHHLTWTEHQRREAGMEAESDGP